VGDCSGWLKISGNRFFSFASFPILAFFASFVAAIRRMLLAMRVHKMPAARQLRVRRAVAGPEFQGLGDGKRQALPGVQLCALFLMLTFAMALGEDLPANWEHPGSYGELAKQFPKHPKRHIQSVRDDPCRATDYGIRQIGIERSACFGKCPAYTLIVNGDGTFQYHGKEFTKRRGDWHGTVDAKQLAVILAYISEMGYFKLMDEYTVGYSDLPGAYTMVRTRTRKKIIYNYGDSGPAKLNALQDMIDRLLGDAKWKRY
jgi:hypothetical protein